MAMEGTSGTWLLYDCERPTHDLDHEGRSRVVGHWLGVTKTERDARRWTAGSNVVAYRVASSNLAPDPEHPFWRVTFITDA